MGIILNESKFNFDKVSNARHAIWRVSSEFPGHDVFVLEIWPQSKDQNLF